MRLQIAYLRVAKQLAQIRGEKLDGALGHDKLEDYPHFPDDRVER